MQRFRKLCLAICLLLTSIATHAESRDTIQIIRINPQYSFPLSVKAGNYSSITYLGNNEYLVVDDKSASDGFHLFTIEIDSLTGNILHVSNQGFVSSGMANRDGEGIAYIKPINSVLISGEADNRILEYRLDGTPTGREAEIPEIFKNSAANMGFEALGYSESMHRLWTCNESPLNGDGGRADVNNPIENRLRFQSFSDSLKAMEQYVYKMDKPIARKPSKYYAMGVSAITPLADGSLLVLEREFYVPPMFMGSFANCKIYQAWPSMPITHDKEITADETPVMDKFLLAEWKTNIGLFKRNIANYEGMCLGPQLANGSQVVVLVSDSQGQYASTLKDWFKTIVIK